MKSALTLIAGASLVAAEEPLQQAQLDALRDPQQGAEEAARLSGCDGIERILSGYHLLRCPQRDGAADLFLLLARRDYDFSHRHKLPWEYDTEGTEELFLEATPSGHAAVPAVFAPTLEPIADAHVMVFDEDGRELRPFGGDNLISRGWVLDFDGDGVLDRSDSTHFHVEEAKDDDIEVFELMSVEREPREFFRVIFNWHPRKADRCNDWTFECFDDDGDGIPEIAFGPENATTVEERRTVRYRWDPEISDYRTDTPHPHVRVIQTGESLATIAKEGGLDYPILDPPDTPHASSAEESPEPDQAPYVHESLVGKDDEFLAEFFHGKLRRSFFGDPETPPASLPEGFWAMDPKAAALALAEHNRLPKHREHWTLALDDRDGVHPPPDGWLVYHWHSSGCYSLSTRSIALRYGSPDARLVVLDYNSIGVVGRNPWADQPGHAARMFELEPEQARFLAETIFWLDRVRSRSRSTQDDDNSGLISSTADGHGTLELHPGEAPAHELLSETVWATRQIPEQWSGAYNRVVAVNLADHLLRHELPARLGEPWSVTPELDHQSLVTPTDERLTRRDEPGLRAQLRETLSQILTQQDLPAGMLDRVVQAAGDEGLVALLPELEALQASLAPPGPDDHELAVLDARFARDHFGSFLVEKGEDHEQAHQRWIELRQARRFDPATILRKPLHIVIERLRLVAGSAALKQAVIDDTPHARWALLELRRTDPDAWAGLLVDTFHSAPIGEKHSLLDTLASGHPEAATALIDSLSPDLSRDLILEIARFHLDRQPGRLRDDLPVLMELVRDRNHDLVRRTEAMRLLARPEFRDALPDEFAELMIREVRDPQVGSYGLNSRAAALHALGRLPATEDGLEAISSLRELDHSSFLAAIETLGALDRGDRPQTERISGLVRSRLKSSDGMMNDTFLAALAFDLRDLAPEIAAMASEGPQFRDGDGANYAGGSFQGPEGGKYHSAREVTGVWSEPDMSTLGRLWVHFVVAHPEAFQLERADGELARALREQAHAAIARLDPTVRERTIREASRLHPLPSPTSSVADWLSGIE